MIHAAHLLLEFLFATTKKKWWRVYQSYLDFFGFSPSPPFVFIWSCAFSFTFSLWVCTPWFALQQMARTGCGNCGTHEQRLLHQIRSRNNFKCLCITCVLCLHPQAFCLTCFLVYTPTLPNDVVRRPNFQFNVSRRGKK